MVVIYPSALVSVYRRWLPDCNRHVRFFAQSMTVINFVYTHVCVRRWLLGCATTPSWVGSVEWYVAYPKPKIDHPMICYERN